ncbi:hypothetical protein ALIPUT_00130 [Alistipes putredinis DSM 17216]|uniref:Uncharacterized protein n=1 Tax=Alistipes putredinis DSM 17216 TaxID=445970 RepID=B0MTM2_9BACT|nr:hypothetical protein ALIPUT_00130 [Alistipes putredinis DSM 17216]
MEYCRRKDRGKVLKYQWYDACSSFITDASRPFCSDRIPLP